MCIKFDMKIILFFVIFYITNKWQTYLLVMLFIFMHEMTHLVVGKMLGVNPLMVEIKSTGCSISFEYKLKDYNKKLLKGNLGELKKIIIYLAGPLFNFFVAIIALLLRANSNLIYINFILGLFNLLWIYPLDGGRILKSLICIFCGEQMAYKIILKVSNIYFILLLIMSSFLILIIHNWGIIIGLCYVAYIKNKCKKEIELKMRIKNIIKKET